MKPDIRQNTYSKLVINRENSENSTSGGARVDNSRRDFDVFKNVYSERKTSFGQKYVH